MHASPGPVTKPISHGGRDFVTALARGLEVLQACAASPEGITMAEAARRTGLARASVRRSLLTLVDVGYVVANGRDFMLTPKVLSLGSGLSSLSLPRVAQPLLDRLAEELGESVSLATLDGPEILYVARSEVRRIVGLTLQAGSRLPAYCTSMGRVLLAALPAEDVPRHLPSVLPARTPHTITKPEALRAVLGSVRDDGFCILDQELELGLRSLSVPVTDAGNRVMAALNVSTQAARTGLRDLHRFLPALQAVAKALRPAFPALPPERVERVPATARARLDRTGPA